MPLPTIVFCENHEDPATPKLMNALLERLRKIGYMRFLDEMPSGFGVERQIDEFTNVSAPLFNEMREKVGVHRLVTDERAAERIVARVGKSDDLTLVKRYAHLKVYIDLLGKLARGGVADIRYDPVDLSFALTDKLGVGHRHRNDVLAYQLMRQTDSCFARFGLLHAQALQRRLVAHGVKTGDYLFVYAYSREEHKAERDYRCGSVDLPLGMMALDLSSEADVGSAVETIMAEVCGSRARPEPSMELIKYALARLVEARKAEVSLTASAAASTGLFAYAGSKHKFEIADDTERKADEITRPKRA